MNDEFEFTRKHFLLGGAAALFLAALIWITFFTQCTGEAPKQFRASSAEAATVLPPSCCKAWAPGVASNPTLTPTRTRVPATFTAWPTYTPEPTSTPIPPVPTSTYTSTTTNTPVPPTATFTATATATNTATPVPPTATLTNTPLPPTATFTFTPTRTATRTPTRVVTATATMENLPKCVIDPALVARDEEENKLLGLINAFRANPAAYNHPEYPATSPLVHSTVLDRASAWHVHDMATKSYFSHNEPNGRTWDQRIRDCGGTIYRTMGENIAAGTYSGSAETAFNQWLNSTGHRNNMASPNFSEIGIAREYGTCSWGGPCWVWSHTLGRR